MRNKKPAKESKKNSFETLLKKINLEEYREFIRQYAARNKDFQTEVEVYFSGKDDRIDVSEKYADLVRKLIRKYSDRGFVDYRAASGLSGEVDRLLDTGYDLAGKGNYRDAFLVAKPILQQMMEVLTTSDDSSGDMGGTVGNIIQLIATVAEADEAAPALKEQVFSFLEDELAQSVYFDYGDFGYDVFRIYQDLAVHLGKTDEFVRFIDAQTPTLTSRYESYRRDFYLKQKIAFFKATGRPETADKLIWQNLDIVEVRQGEVNKAIDRQDLASAKKLIADGIRLAQEKDHPGTVARWQKELLRIALLEKDTDAIRQYTKHFAFDRGFDEDYYNQWKKTYSPAEWKKTIEQYLEEKTKAITEANEKKRGTAWNRLNSPLLLALAPVYIAEGYWDRLLALVKQENSLSVALRYHQYLFDKYPADLLEIYLPAFQRQGDQVSSRPQYAELAGTMKKVMEDIPQGKERIKAIARELKAKYARKSALVDELNAVLR